MPYDPTIYLGCAPYYARGRPPYSRELGATLVAEVGLDGAGRLLDVGCGPGVLTLELADRFEEAIGLDPDPDMLTEAQRRAAEAGVTNVRWVRALAEDIPDLGLGTFRLVTFGQSFWWTDAERVAEAVYDVLQPGGALALVVHRHEGRPVPTGPDHPPIPHDAIHALIQSYLGPQRRAGQGFTEVRPAGWWNEVIARTRFGGPPRVVYAPGRPDIVQDVEGVLANFHSTSFAAPHLFGDRLEAFHGDFRAVLLKHAPDGLFRDWPGDTKIDLVFKRA